MSWITHILPKIKREDDNERKPSPIPEGVWTKCPGCEQPLYTVRVDLQRDGETVDTWEKRIGLRTMTMHIEKDRYLSLIHI